MSDTDSVKNLENEKSEKVAGAPLSAKEEWTEFAKTAFVAVLLALFIRTFFFEPFNIPSGSMKPGLQVGDYLFVSKPAYGYSRHSFPFSIAPIEGRLWEDAPERGDVVVFKLPTNPSIDYIKRVIGLPGDKIQVIGGQLYINGLATKREPLPLVRLEEDGRGVTRYEFIETLPGGATFHIYEDGDQYPLDNTKVFEVPPRHYFMMGDNRDNSQDSRVMDHVGFVPLENIVGRADFIFFSVDENSSIFEFWKWPWSIRTNRLLMDLDPLRLDEDTKPPSTP
jgi:signal peptidase I